MSSLKIGIIGCGFAARIHAGRLSRLPGVQLVGCADPDPSAAESLVAALGGPENQSIPSFKDHQELLEATNPDALAIFTPPLVHYRPAMDGLQAGCHVFVEKPLATNLQEAVDIVNLARGRGLVVAVGHQYRLAPSLIEAKRQLAEGAIGRLRTVVGLMTAPWLADHQGPENAWRLDPAISGGGLVADAGDHLLDALLWTTCSHAAEVAAFQDREAGRLDVVSAVSVQLDQGIPATLALSGVTSDSLFELTYVGESGILRVTETTLSRLDPESGRMVAKALPDSDPALSIDADFAAAIRDAQPPCCPAIDALETVRLQQAITRSVSSGSVVRLAATL